MRLFKLLISFFSFCFLFVAFASPAWAQSEFTINFNTTYDVGLDGSAEVAQRVNLTNNLSRVYATSYSLILEGKEPKNIRVVQDGKTLPVLLSREDEQWKVEITFPDAVVGKGEGRNFTIEYELSNFAVQNGKVWELSVPKLASPEVIAGYSLQLRVPRQFGPPAYVSPEPRQKTTTTDPQIFIFQKQDLTHAGIVAGFGDFQVFSFNLSYHLKNPYSKTGEAQIALPPDTAYQRVYYEQIDPQPKNITLDEDGNWLATYRLGANQSLDVTASGAVQIFTTPQEHFPQNITGNDPRYLASSKFWPIEDPSIQEIASRFPTPREIYDFVVNTLSYDYSRVREGVERLGAKNALSSPSTAICMEFTDTFIALARAAGIPAREINGFAYTENPEIQPLSLVADVLHAWPEYWDREKKVWQPIDPTWGNTTGGVDFFNKFDLSHFVFAIHGTDVGDPPPAGSYKTGASPQKDVNVEFGSLPETGNSNLQFSASLPRLLLPLQDTSLELTIKNPGPAARYNLPVSFTAQGLRIKSGEEKIDFLPPLAEIKIPIMVRLPFLPAKPQSLNVDVGDSSFRYNIPVARVLALQVSTVFAVLAGLIGVMLIFHFRIHAKIARTIAKLTQRSGGLPF